MASLPKGLNINNTLGAVLIGFAVACCVYGILVTQVFRYFSRYPFDRPVYKGLVRVSGVLPCFPSAEIKSYRFCSFCTRRSFRHFNPPLTYAYLCPRRLLETVDQIFIGHVVYHYTISNFANVSALIRGTVTWCVVWYYRSVH